MLHFTPKILKIRNLIVLILLNTFTVFSQDVNILAKYNGDFENGLTYWRFFEVPNNIGSTQEITNDAVSGNQALKLVWVEADASIQDRGFDNWTAGVPVLAENEYTVMASMKSEQASGLRVTFTIGFFDIQGGVISQVNKVYDLTETYTAHEFTVTAPENAMLCWIAFRMFDEGNARAAGTMYLDDVRLIGPSVDDLSPRLMTATIPGSDVPIASVDVTEAPYNAKKDGSADATVAFQNAINRASVAGGAVVFAPAGTYRFDGTLNIPERVVLRGEWENPDSVGGVSGTILMPYGGKGSEEGDPFISIQRGSGIKNLSIWYPEQNISAVQPYPWTIQCTSVSTSVINLNLVNSFKGIKVLPDPNALHYFRNVYGTPLNQGIWLSQTTDIGRIMNVHFEPKYWSESGLSDAPSKDAILSYLQNSPSTGIIMGRSDWEYIYDVSLIGYQTGMQIIKYTDMGPNGVIYGLRVEKSKIGIDLVNINPIGWAFTNAIINVEGENSICVKAGDAFNSVVQFNTCSFGGDPETAILFSGNAIGRLSFQNCTFENWGQTEDSPAIDCPKGSVSLVGNTFKLDKLHLRLGANVKNAQLLDNSFPSVLKLDNQSNGEILVSQEPLNFSKQDVPPHPYAAVPRPAKNDLYDIIDYGAIADGATDNSAAIQTALDAAGLNGGGTVYIPSGMYRINSHLIVPSGVELRGIWDVPHHSMSMGSILLAYEGRDDAEGTPFISLESGSGVRGFTVWYPKQNTTSFSPYPWSIQSLGENCWIKDLTLGNTYQGVDLASYPSAGHVVSYLGGAPLKTGISVDQSNGDGWIENVQFNPHYWAHTSGFPQDFAPDINTIISFQQSNLDGFKIATATDEHVLGNFIFAAKHGFYLAADNGNSRVNVFLHGTDAGNSAVYLESKAGSVANFVNTQLVLLGTTQTGIISSSPGFDANVSFYNSISWGGPGPTTNLYGNGNILIQQMHTLNGLFKHVSGSARLENICISSSPNPQYNLGSGISKFKLFGSYARNGFVIYDYVKDRSAVEIDYIYKKNSKESTFSTGWENNEIQNTWDNTLFGHKDFENENPIVFQCEALDTDTAHTGLRALKIDGAKINETAPYYKVFDSRISVFYNSTFSYWLNPQNESGKTGHLDLLFTDGTRLTELSALAEDGLVLNAARSEVGEWVEVKCPIGNYAHGKTIQSVLVGAELKTEEQYSFLIDDFNTDGISSISASISDQQNLFLDQNHPNPFNDQTYLRYQLNQPGLVTLSIHDMLGRKITTLTNDQYQYAGSHELSWTPKKLEAGMYFCRLVFLSDQGNKTILNRKMILSR